MIRTVKLADGQIDAAIALVLKVFEKPDPRRDRSDEIELMQLLAALLEGGGEWAWQGLEMLPLGPTIKRTILAGLRQPDRVKELEGKLKEVQTNMAALRKATAPKPKPKPRPQVKVSKPAAAKARPPVHAALTVPPPPA